MKNLKIDEIIKTQHNASAPNHHTSLLRSHAVLKKTIQMIKRNDSKETIFEMIDFCYGFQHGFDYKSLVDEVL